MTRVHLSADVDAVLLIALGGSLGASMRYAVGATAGESLLVTLFVNATGCFLLGLLLFDARAGEYGSKRLRYVFGAGFCASFTTYSTFVADAVLNTAPVALLYIGASYAAGFGAILASRWVIEIIGESPVRTPQEGD